MGERRYSKRVEEFFSVIEGTPGHTGKPTTKADVEKILFLKDSLSEKQFQTVVDALFAGKVSLSKVYSNIYSKINKKETTTASPAGILLKKLIRSNKALSKQLEAYDGSMILLPDEEALVLAFADSLVSLFFRFSDILEALGNPQEHEIEDEEEE